MLDCTASIVAYGNSHQMIRMAAKSFLCNSLKNRLYIVDNSPAPTLRNCLNDLSVDYHFYGQNVGYGRAHNWAINHSADSHYHLIMNPDVFITEGTIEKLVAFMNANTDVGVVCPRVLNEDGSDQYLNKRYPNIMDLFIRRFVPRIFHRLFKRRMAHYEMRDIGYDKAYDVEVMSGAFMFCRKEVLKLISGFDPRYFLYFEDFDLSRKFQQHGFRTAYYPNASVVHVWERTAHKNIKITMIFIANMFRYFNKWGWKWL
ncbi:MAG: glycosyltransferase family 2 protein [Syntrophaceae bacterium]|nr:glycosyltransferase family 2 protein [Syntrophaceae bacterium]